MNNDKYTRAIELMNAVPGRDPSKSFKDTPEELVVEACARWDELYTFVHDNFVRPNSYHEFGEYKRTATWAHENPEAQQDIADTYELLCKHKKDEVLARLMTVPPEYRDVVFPVAIARYLLAYQNVPIWPNKTTTFNEFHHRYAVMIVEGVRLQSRQPKAA